MALPKPSSHLNWTDGNASKVVEPSGAKKLLGWVALERPPFEYMNCLFYTADLWNKYHESVTDETTLARVDAIVNADGDGTHLTLQDAHDDADVVAGSTILITSDLELDATVEISKPDIEIRMQPGKRIKKGGSAAATNFVGVRLLSTADRVRLHHMAFGSVTGAEKFSGAGDAALQIQAGCANAFLFNPVFVTGNTTDLDDSGTDTEVVSAQAGLPQ
jgi:hypothetical protein